ncbi:SpaN/EivJ family type III secretion system needle length determinant [Serratia quinivorans]|uniref:SpaN/EivJ family type III secretion system needle length determinant n=1 Tax=Serratia quinivorans TaxID=137545 RepID=UPI0039822E5A
MAEINLVNGVQGKPETEINKADIVSLTEVMKKKMPQDEEPISAEGVYRPWFVDPMLQLGCWFVISRVVEPEAGYQPDASDGQTACCLPPDSAGATAPQVAEPDVEKKSLSVRSNTDNMPPVQQSTAPGGAVALVQDNVQINAAEIVAQADAEAEAQQAETEEKSTLAEARALKRTVTSMELMGEGGGEMVQAETDDTNETISARDDFLLDHPPMEYPLELSVEGADDMAATDAVSGSKLSYQFTRWGDTHHVDVTLQEQDYDTQLQFEPSDTLVEQRMEQQWEHSDIPENWQIVQEESGQQHQQSGHRDGEADEEEIP